MAPRWIRRITLLCSIYESTAQERETLLFVVSLGLSLAMVLGSVGEAKDSVIWWWSELWLPAKVYMQTLHADFNADYMLTEYMLTLMQKNIGFNVICQKRSYN